MSEAGSELAVIERTLKTDRDAYFADPAMRGRYAELLAERDTGTPAPVTSSHARELAAIERKMRDDREGYWKNTDLQKRYRELLTAPAEDDPNDWRTPPAEMKRHLPADIIVEWGENFDMRLRTMQDSLAAIVSGIENKDEAAALLESFGQFSIDVETSVYRELALPPMTAVKWADADEMATFRALDFGRPLIEAWGRGAERNVGMFFERFGRIQKNLSQADIDHLETWFYDLINPAERIAIIWALCR